MAARIETGTARTRAVTVTHTPPGPGVLVNPSFFPPPAGEDAQAGGDPVRPDGDVAHLGDVFLALDEDPFEECREERPAGLALDHEIELARRRRGVDVRRDSPDEIVARGVDLFRRLERSAAGKGDGTDLDSGDGLSGLGVVRG